MMDVACTEDEDNARVEALRVAQQRAEALARDLQDSLNEATRLRQAAEDAQRKAEDIAQLPLHNPDPLLKVDLRAEKILFFNPAAYNRYPELLREGLEHALLLGIRDVGLRAFDERKSQLREVQVGKITYQQVITPTLLQGGRVVVVYHYDITRLKETEETLRTATERAEAASRAKSDFLANMSHELRTPMNAVMGLAGLLKDSALPLEQQELARAIYSSGEALLQLLNDILDLSKIEAGELRFEETPFHLRHLAQETVRLFETLARSKGLQLHLEYSAAAPDFVVGDPARVRQILSNLIGNAVKFTETGHVRVDIHARTGAPLTEFLFRVDDTGIGIAAKDCEKIFSKFTQADESTARRFGGTGLGLAICKLLVTALGGQIGVASQPGKGSSFWFTLNLTQPSAEATAALQAEAAPSRPVSASDMLAAARLLVVDDHPINLMFARKALQKLGVRTVDTAEDGTEALRLHAQGRYDLVITDCQMPEMDGYAVARAIRAREQNKGAARVPIIAMTANAMKGDREACLVAGMDDYVSKPIALRRLHEVLHQWLPKNPAENLISAAEEEESPMSAPEHYSLPVVDVDHLTAFIGDDAEERQTIVAIFLDVAETARQVLAAHRGGDLEARGQWKRAAHKLKGSAANFGAQPLSEVCRTAEEAADADPAEKDRVLAEIAQALDAVRAALAVWLAQEGAAGGKGQAAAG